MNGFTEHRASGASASGSRDDRVFTWGAGRAMLPLVGRIAADLVGQHRRLALLQPERARLDRQRHTLAWPERARRYQLHDEITSLQDERRQTLAELEALGVILLDRAIGLVGFPTIVNDRRAFFSWQLGEEGLQFWNYAGDRHRRPVPEAWTRSPRESSGKKGRSRSQK